MVSVQMCRFSAWIDLSLSKSYRLSLWLDENRFKMFMNWFMSESYQSFLSRIIKLSDSLWIDSNLHLGRLNRFKYHMNCVNLHNLSLFLGLSFLVSESIHWFNESTHSVVFVQKWCLVTSHYINPSRNALLLLKR